MSRPAIDLQWKIPRFRRSATAPRIPGVAAPSPAAPAPVAVERWGVRIAYRCDAQAHCVVASDAQGRLLFAFGSFGTGPGQFDTPTDVTLVAPSFDGEASDPTSDSVWVAVADYGNRRVQVFEPDGTFIASIDDLDHHPPCRLIWRDPVLEVQGIEGGRQRYHLASAILFASRESAFCPENDDNDDDPAGVVTH
jgi:hypothetical protein